MFRIKMTAIEEVAKTRPIGYYADCLSHGIIDGEFLLIQPDNYRMLLTKYRPNPPTGSHIRGLGDLVAIPAQVIARGIDRVLGTNVAGCGGCKRRQEYLNTIIPFGDTK